MSISDADGIELCSNWNMSSPEQPGYGATPGSGATAVEDFTLIMTLKLLYNKIMELFWSS